MLVGYGAALLGTFDVEESQLTDASNITRVGFFALSYASSGP